MNIIKGMKNKIEIASLILRVFVGLVIAFGHGIKKVPPSDGFIESVANFGFPIPFVFAWAAGISEFIGGLLLALGLATRPASFFLIMTMLVAIFIRHGDDPFASKEKAILYFFIFLFYLIAGSGKFGLDRIVRRR